MSRLLLDNLAACTALGLFFLVAAACPTLSAEAQDEVGPSEGDIEIARHHFQAGDRYLLDGQFDRALQEFTRSYELSQRPQLLYNIALCHDGLGNFGPAVEHMERFLSEVHDLPDRAEKEELLASMRQRLNNLIADRVAAAERLSEQSRFDAAAAQYEDAISLGGPPELHVALANQYLSLSREDEARQQLEAYLEAVPEGEGADAVRTQLAEMGQETNGPDRGPDQRHEPPPPRRGLSTGAIVSFAVGGAALVSFAVAAPLAIVEDRSLEDCTPVCDSGEVGGLRRRTLTADISLGIGIAGAALGTILALVGRSDGTERETTPTISGFIDRHGGGLSAAAHF